MKIQPLTQTFTVCKLNKDSDISIETKLAMKGICFVARTDEEVSLVCESPHVPAHTLEREDGWRAFRITGVLDFSLIGILSKISGILARERIGIFVVSTFNTDYVLVKADHFREALLALEQEGYEILQLENIC